jgi:protein-L-isoaspartate(D-aspartate) O-methyltransferase
MRLRRWCGAVILASAACAAPMGESAPAQDWDAQRAEMVRNQLRGRDISNARVLAAMSRVPRHMFVPESVRGEAYGDFPLPIGHGQTISQPYIVGFMSQALDIAPHYKVLEIGTGSGYQAAILAELAKEVYTIEIVAPLADRARATIEKLGYRNVRVRTGNGYLGWPEYAPYDCIMVTAAPDDVPPALVAQLRVGGRMAIPVGSTLQELKILRRTEGGVETLQTLPVRFVPMVGKPK